MDFPIISTSLCRNLEGYIAKGQQNQAKTHMKFTLISTYSYVSLFVSTTSCDIADEHRIQLAQLHGVLKTLLLPEVCDHTAMERKFEWTTGFGKTGCEYYCSHYRGGVRKFTKRVNKEGLQSLLTKIQEAADKVPVGEFLKSVKQERKTIGDRDAVPP